LVTTLARAIDAADELRARNVTDRMLAAALVNVLTDSECLLAKQPCLQTSGQGRHPAKADYCDEYTGHPESPTGETPGGSQDRLPFAQ
jgi:hypothetical protein